MKKGAYLERKKKSLLSLTFSSSLFLFVLSSKTLTWFFHVLESDSKMDVKAVNLF